MASDRPSAPTGAATKPCAISKFRFEFRDCGAGCGPGSARQKTTVNRTLGRADRLIDGRDTLLAQFRRSSRPRSQTTTESTLAKRRTPPGGGVRAARRRPAPSPAVSPSRKRLTARPTSTPLLSLSTKRKSIIPVCLRRFPCSHEASVERTDHSRCRARARALWRLWRRACRLVDGGARR